MTITTEGCGSSTRSVGGASEPCGEPQLINARWREETVKCGDEAGMLADTVNIPAGTNATFTLKRTSDNGTITSESGNTQPSSVTGTWVSQKSSDTWNGAEVKFSVSAAGLQAESADPQLSFHRYADISRSEFRRHMSSGVYGWERAVMVEFTDRIVVIHVPIKIRKTGTLPERHKNESYAAYARRWVPPTYIPGTHDLSAGEKVALKNSIEGYYRRKMILHRAGCRRHSQSGGCADPLTRKCCKFEIQMMVHFYNLNDSTAPSWASVVNYWSGSDRANSSNWFEGDLSTEPWVMAHETGHLMGFYDEYQPDGATGSAPWQPTNSSGLMGSGTGLETYYFNEYANWLGDSSRTNERWAVMRYS
jgi:hypothetical protein